MVLQRNTEELSPEQGVTEGEKMTATDVCCKGGESRSECAVLSRPLMEQMGGCRPRGVQRPTCDHAAGYYHQNYLVPISG